MADLLMFTALVFSVTYRVILDWRALRLMSPLSAITGLNILLFYLPAFFLVKEVNFIVLAGSSILVFLNFLNPKPFRKPLSILKFRNRHTVRLFFKLIFILHMFISAVLAAQIILEFGVIGGLVRNRLEGYLGSVGVLNILNSLWFASQFGYYFYLSRIFESNRKTAFLLSFLYVCALLYYANTRLSILVPVGVMLSFYVWYLRLKIKQIFVLSITLVMIMPSFLVYSNATRHGIDLKNVNYNLFDFIVYQFDYNKYIEEIELYYANPTQKYEYGYGWFLASAVNVIPRAFYTDKPITSFSNRLTVDITGQEVSYSNPVRTYTILGTGYSQFGVIGSMFEVSLYLYIFSRFFYTFLAHKHLRYFAFYMAIYSLLYFRGETPFIQILIIYLTALIGTDACKTTNLKT